MLRQVGDSTACRACPGDWKKRPEEIQVSFALGCIFLPTMMHTFLLGGCFSWEVFLKLDGNLAWANG